MNETRATHIGELTTPVSSNGFLIAACGEGIRLAAIFTQNWPTIGLMSKTVADVMFSAIIAKELHAELGRNLERHEKMFGPIPSREYVNKAWAEVVAPDLIDGYEKEPPKP